MISSASPSHFSTPPPPPRHFPLRHHTPFATPLDTTTHRSSPSSSAQRSGSSSKSIGSIHVARIADRRGVNLAQVLDFAQAEVSIRGEKRRRRQRLELAPSLLLATPDDQTTILAVLGDSSYPLTPDTMTTTSPAITSSWSGTGPVSPSGPLPPVDESFMRWSRTASIFSDHSAPSTFYFTGRSTGAYSEFHTSSPLPSATDATFPPSSFPIPMSHPLTNTPPRPRPDPKRRESANSAGTFGDRQRRWSALHSTSGGPTHDDFSPSESANDTPIEEDVQFGSTSSRTRNGRRPLSMSSASDSFSGPSNVVAERVHIGRSNISGATFPSPTLRRPIHTSPESTADITAHLLKASGKNDSRIVPRLTPAKQAPTVGTPIASEVREEGSPEHREKRKTSKLDQILGEGAETARVLMEFDRRDRKAIHDIVDLSGMTPLPPPPRHRPSTAPSPSTIPILPPQTPPTHLGRADRHTRSASVDSPPSSPHPSIAESTHTNARLILSQSPPSSSSFAIQPTDKDIAELYAIAKPDLHNDLSPEQRAILVRRTRKIEQMLGEPLSESRVGQHVVRPSTASAVMQTTHDELWPSSSTASRTRVPEYDQQDCQPRTVRAAEKPPTPALKGSSKIALKAMAALGLVDKKEEDIRVYVSKETTVTEVVQNTAPYPTARRASEQTTRGTGRAKAVEASDEPESPKSPKEERSDSPEDAARRARRTQAAKISRLLGEPVPASALPSHQTDSPRTLSSDTISLHRPDTPQRSHSANGQSFMSIGESTPSPSWAKRMRSAVASVKDRDKDKDKERDKGSSFWDGSLPSKDKGKKGSSPPGFRTWSPSHDQFSGNRDNLQSSFMDMRESRNVAPGSDAAGVGGSYGAKRAPLKQGVW